MNNHGVLKEMLESYKNGMKLEKLLKRFGGMQVYIPKVMPDYKERILEEHNGYNDELLADKYNTTVRQVKRIVAKAKKDEKNSDPTHPPLPLFRL